MKQRLIKQPQLSVTRSIKSLHIPLQNISRIHMQEGFLNLRLSRSTCCITRNLNTMAKREKTFRSIGSLKQKRPNDVEHSNKAARTETFKQLSLVIIRLTHMH